MKNIYQELYSEKRVLNLKNSKRLMIMKQMVDLKSGNSILDIGCYDGSFLSFFKNQRVSLYGIEASEFGVKKSKEKGIKVKDFYFDDKTKLPFKENSFDYIIAGEMIEHIYDTDFFLDEVYRLLKKNGYFVLSTPNLASLGRRLRLIVGLNPIIELSPNEKDSSGHIRYFVKQTLFDLLDRHKFMPVNYKSDLVNFTNTGRYHSTLLARFFPTLGQSLIVKCRKVQQPNKLHLVLVNAWPFMIKTPHFGLTSLAAFIKEKLPEVKISIVEGVDPIKEILAKEPDLIGITSDTIAFTKTLKLVKKIKSRHDVPIIIGGVHITALPETLNPAFQLGVIGEGEITLLELLKVFKKYRGFPKRAIAEIKGIVYRDKKKLITTGKREPISNIDSLPYPARDLAPMEELYLRDQLNLFGVRRLATMMTSRGCPYSCVFCGSPVQWPGVRFHSPEYVVKEMKFLLKKYRIDGVMFWDDLFISPEVRLVKLVKLIKKEGLHKKLTFFGYARANLINEKVCRILQEINTKRLIFGLESGSEKILGYLKNHSVTIADNQRAVKLCRKYGITSSSGFIVGTPGEKIKDLRKTYQFIKKYPLDNMHIFFLTPYPGTEIWNIAQKKGLVSEEMDFGSLFVQSPPLSFFDFFRKSKPEMIKGRVFLNQEYSQNKQYLDLIFKMQKLVYWQNLFFYLKTVPRDMNLIKTILKLKLKQYDPGK